MVTGKIRTAASRLATKATKATIAAASRLRPKPEKAPERRLLVVIRAQDGDLVLQKKREDHQPRHHYKAEARTLMQSLFPPKPEQFCARSKADRAFHEVLNFKRTSDIHTTKRHFERKGVEWHPVLFDIAYLGFDMEAVKAMAKKGKGMKSRILRPLSEHEYAEELLERFPRVE